MTTGASRNVRVSAAAKGMNTWRAKYNTMTDPTINVIGLMFDGLPEIRRSGLIPECSSFPIQRDMTIHPNRVRQVATPQAKSCDTEPAASDHARNSWAGIHDRRLATTH